MSDRVTGGGQIFLHKIRMLLQVIKAMHKIALVVGIICAVGINAKQIVAADWYAFVSYRKAVVADEFDRVMEGIRLDNKNKAPIVSYISASTKRGLYAENIAAYKLLRLSMFKDADLAVQTLAIRIATFTGVFTLIAMLIIGLFWRKIGSNLKDEKILDADSARILTAKEVKKHLKSAGIASNILIGEMPLVKDSETRHLLITGSTGSGKTNLFHNILPQVEQLKHPAIVIDQTGEMIAKYYNAERGDIIFNPFDARSKIWDFWSDCASGDELEKFAKILFGFNRKKGLATSDPFWETSAEVVFTSCVQYLINDNNRDIDVLKKMITSWSLKELRHALEGTPASRYLTTDGKATASSILSVLVTSAKPLTHLNNISPYESENFSLKGYFGDIKRGSDSWLFLATKPSNRELAKPLIACLLELAFLELMAIGINNKRKLWFVIDELPALGNLPALLPIMAEGRKYGACILAGMQSLNQLNEIYGSYTSSVVFGQFGTKLFFRNDEPALAEMISKLCGTRTIIRNQKNTSFGAHEYRDGISYSEQERTKRVVEYQDIASLKAGECFCLLPEPKVRLSKLQVPLTAITEKNEGFVEQPKRLGLIPEQKPVNKENNAKAENDGDTGVAEGIADIAVADADESTNFSGGEFVEPQERPKEPQLEGGFKL